MSARKTQSQYNRANEAKHLSEGARRIPGGLLSPDAVDAMENLRDSGYESSYARIIARALVEAASRGTPR